MTTAKQAIEAQKAKQAQLTPTEQMRGLLVQMSKEIQRALPENVKSERFQRVVLTAFSNNPKLQQCKPVSFLAAMMQSAQLGLEPNTPLGQAYLIPYKDSVQFQLGYKGLIDLAMRTGQYESIYAHTVYENDEFDMDYGLEQFLKHKPLLRGDRGKPIGYYGVYRLINGGFGFAYMTREKAEAHGRKFSKTYNNGPWQTDFDAMAKKTVIKQALKYAPLAIEMQKATALDNSVVKEEKAESAIDENVIETAWELVDEETGEVKDETMNEVQGDFFGDDFKPMNFPEP